jgi:hypothetical protein
MHNSQLKVIQKTRSKLCLEFKQKWIFDNFFCDRTNWFDGVRHHFLISNIPGGFLMRFRRESIKIGNRSTIIKVLREVNAAIHEIRAVASQLSNADPLSTHRSENPFLVLQICQVPIHERIEDRQ